MVRAPLQVVMVCHGNICRSPMAAAVAGELLARAGLGDRVRVSSAGTSGEHEGQGMDPRAAQALRARGWPVPPYRAKRLRPDAVAPGSWLLCADRANLAALSPLGLVGELRLLRSFDPDSVPGRDEVPDPWYGGPEDFERALITIERACQGLVGHLAAELGPAPKEARRSS